MVDVWSRRIVGWRVHARESAQLAATMTNEICRPLDIDPKGLVLHSDNGKPMRGSTMIATLQWLGIVPSFSRPHVSDDSPHSESLFRTLKHTPAHPQRPFPDVRIAVAWVARFVAWYNHEHRHSALRFVTPDQRHSGAEGYILRARPALYAAARKHTPARWTVRTRNWEPVKAVTLAPRSLSAELMRQQP